MGTELLFNEYRIPVKDDKDFDKDSGGWSYNVVNILNLIV